MPAASICRDSLSSLFLCTLLSINCGWFLCISDCSSPPLANYWFLLQSDELNFDNQLEKSLSLWKFCPGNNANFLMLTVSNMQVGSHIHIFGKKIWGLFKKVFYLYSTKAQNIYQYWKIKDHLTCWDYIPIGQHIVFLNCVSLPQNDKQFHGNPQTNKKKSQCMYEWI